MLKDPVCTAVMLRLAKATTALFAWVLHLKAAVRYQDLGRKKTPKPNMHFCLGGDPGQIISGAGAVKGRMEVPVTGFGSP